MFEYQEHFFFCICGFSFNNFSLLRTLYRPFRVIIENALFKANIY